MPQKIILTEHQHNLIINEIVKEMLKDVNEEALLSEEPIDEGLWTNIKYGLAKIGGRYKAGGKIFGKKKVDQEAAAKIKTIIDKKGNEMIKKLDDEIKQQNPEFPNNKEPKDFLNTILAISTVYDSVVAATQKDPKDETYMPIDVANGIINDLRDYVKKFLDVDLKSLYSGLDEEIEAGGIELSEEDLREIDETWGLNEDYSDAVTEEEINEDESSDMRDKLNADRTARGGGKDFDSERMKTLKSNKLPLMLAGVGGSMGGLSWLAQTEWFKHWLEGLLGADHTITTPEIVKDVTGGAADDKGMVHWMSDINQGEGLPPVKTGADVQAFVDRFGANKVEHMFDGNGAGPSATQVQQLQQLVDGDNASKSVGEIFNPKNSTFGSMKHGQNLFGVSKSATFLGQIVVKQAQKILIKGAGTALAAKFAGLAGVLGPIGVGIMAAGALVKIMRVKGQKSSRAATLNALYQSMRNIEGGVGIVEPEGPTDKDVKDGGGDKGQGGDGKGGVKGAGGFDDDLYNSLKNLFKFIVNNRKMLGVRAADNVGTGEASAGSKSKGDTSTPETFKKGDKVIYKGRNLTVVTPNSSPGNTEVDADGDGPGKRTYAVKTADLKRPLSEAKYIKDKRLVQFLQKNLSFDKLKSFEDFINRVEIIRNKVKKLGNSEDKAIQNFMKSFDSNPIMATNFSQLFSIDPDNAQATNALKAFIDDIFVSVYSGKFKYGNMIDKMAKLGDGDINKIQEEKGYNSKEPNKAFVKDAQDRGRFKKNLIEFMTTAINLFQYLHKQKAELAKGGGKKGGTAAGGKSGGGAGTDGGSDAGGSGAPTATPPSGGGAEASDSDASSGASGGSAAGGSGGPIPFKPATYESVNGQNKILTEEIERIKKIMSSLI